MSDTAFEPGQRVKWSWGNGEGEGVVAEVFTAKVTRTIKGKGITRKASPDRPAVLIKQDDGDRVLKSVSELTPA
jgi:hypothetical protein